MKDKWQKAFTIEKERVKEFVELYKEMNYEVKVKNAKEEPCNKCFNDNYKTIYIKKKK